MQGNVQVYNVRIPVGLALDLPQWCPPISVCPSPQEAVSAWDVAQKALLRGFGASVRSTSLMFDVHFSLFAFMWFAFSTVSTV